MTSRYSYCLSKVLGHEGGVSDRAADRGGLTSHGVTTKTYNDFCARTGRYPKPVTSITREEIELIYGQYWLDAHCARFAQPLDVCVFDTAINSGPKKAVILLQRALGMPEKYQTGNFGPITTHELSMAMDEEGVNSICTQYLDARRRFYYAIVAHDPTQVEFLNGWLSRLEKLEGEME